MTEINAIANTEFFVDGQQVIEYVTNELEGYQWNYDPRSAIKALILDF